MMDSKNSKKQYSNNEITVLWQPNKCSHAANCVKHNSAIFKPKEKPWIKMENGTTDEIIESVKKCPSGALTFFWNEEY